MRRYHQPAMGAAPAPTSVVDQVVLGWGIFKGVVLIGATIWLAHHLFSTAKD